MKNRLPILMFILSCVTIAGCNKGETYKICEYQTDDRQLKVYNDVLNDLIAHRFYNGYLAKAFEEHPYDYGEGQDFDTARFNRDRVKYHNQIFNDTSYFQNIYLDTALRHSYWDDYFPKTSSDSTPQVPELMELFDAFKDSPLLIIDTLTLAQSQYRPSDFHLCVARLKLYKRPYDFSIPRVSFSKIFFHPSKPQAMLYYEFICDTKCGFGEVLLAEEVNGHWIIKDRYELWIS